MPDNGREESRENPDTTRATSSTRRPRFNTIRNQNLATIANIENNFKGKNKHIPVIGKIHEKGVSFERFMEDVRDYVATEYDEGDDLELLLETQVDDFDLAADTKLPGLVSTSEEAKAMFESDYAEYRKREKSYKNNKRKLFGLIYGQCTPTLLASIKSQKTFSENFKKKDTVWLMEVIKKLSVGIDDNANDLLTAHDALKLIYNMVQGKTEPNDKYMERFKETWNAAVASSGSVKCLVPVILDQSDKYKNFSEEEKIEATKALYFFIHADRIRFGSKINQVNAGVVLGTDQYPTNLDKAYAILTETQKQMDRDRIRQNTSSSRARSEQGQSNYQNDRSIPDGETVVMGTDRRVFNVQCNRCNAWGHYASACPQVSNEVSSKALQNITKDHTLTSLCYILDTGSTHNTVKDKDDIINLTNLFKNKVLNMRSSTGNIMKYHKKGMLQPFGVESYYNSSTAANILAFHTLSSLKDAHMLYDSRQGDCFRLIYKNGKELQFQNCGDGLYTFVNPINNKIVINEKETKEQNGTKVNKETTDININKNRKVNTNIINEDDKEEDKENNINTQYLQTVKKNELLMTNKERERAKEARELQEYLGWPSTQEYINIINGNEIRNVDVTVDDIKRALILYGEPTACLKGKMTRRRPLSHDTMDFLQQPLPIQLLDKRVELYIDLYKFAGVWFIIMESSRIKYIEIEVATSQTIEHIIEHVTHEIDKYSARGLQISGVHVDNQFNKSDFERAIKPAILIPYAAEEHVAVIERRIRTVKERMRSILSGMPYKSIPKVMVRGLAKKVKQMINKFPVRKGGVSTTISPEEIIEGKRKMNGNRKRINFGQYAEIHDGTTNKAEVRSVGGIAMYATNDREGFAFMCLDSGKSRHSNNWTVKPITDDIIKRVENISKESIDTEVLIDELSPDELIAELDSAQCKENILRAERRSQIQEIREQDDTMNMNDMDQNINITEEQDVTDNEQSITDNVNEINENESVTNQEDNIIEDTVLNISENESDVETIEPDVVRDSEATEVGNNEEIQNTLQEDIQIQEDVMEVGNTDTHEDIVHDNEEKQEDVIEEVDTGIQEDISKANMEDGERELISESDQIRQRAREKINEMVGDRSPKHIINKMRERTNKRIIREKHVFNQEEMLNRVKITERR